MTDSERLHKVYQQRIAAHQAELKRRLDFANEKAKYGQDLRQYGKILSATQTTNKLGITAEQMQFCHRYLRRKVPYDSLVGLPSKRVILGKTFITACDRAIHSVKTDEWRIDYNAINSTDGWRYTLIRFDGNATAFANDLMMIRTTR